MSYNFQDISKKSNILSFIDNYWDIVGSSQETSEIRKNKHFKPLTEFLIDTFGEGIPEDKIPTKYRLWKKWDINFPNKKIAIEYKSITSKSIEKCKYLRIEEALGSAIDVKKKDPNYKLGFLLMFALPEVNNKIIKSRDYMISAFENMVIDGIYDIFCPIQTTSIGNYEELSVIYTFDHFLNSINNYD